MTTGLLIIDELGFQDLDRRDGHLLFKVISHRFVSGEAVFLQLPVLGHEIQQIDLRL